MRFETQIILPCLVPTPCDNASQPADCADPDFRASNLSICPLDDPRCSDPDFAEANPSLCLNSPRLILKPSSAQVPVLGQVVYRAILWANGVETLLIDGVTFSSADLSLAALGVSSGNATGIAEGITTIIAKYGGMTAFARLTIVASCAGSHSNFLMLFDVSKSSTGVFGGYYATRLSAAKAYGEGFVSTINFTKDQAAVLSFDDASAEVQAFTQSLGLLTAAIQGLAPAQGHTNLASALQVAQEFFTTQGVTGNNVIVLFTDGENNEGSDPSPVAQAIRDAGIVLIIVASRAKGNSFRLLNSMASGGFFINALPSNTASVPDWLNGLKSYLCSGNCAPTGNVTVGMGTLNFNSFINWDVIAGHVDLCGFNAGGVTVYDYLPGNGLYVDGCGSSVDLAGDPDLGTIRAKSLVGVTVGHQLKLKVAIAGNQREDRTPDVTTISLVSQTGATLASLVCTVTDYAQGFTDYTLSYTVGAGVTGVRVVIAQTSIATGGEASFGNWWDNVRLTDHTAADVALFTDTFDGDNPTYIPPCDSQGSYSGGSYHCYNFGCLTAPIPAQLPDSSPLQNLEGEPPLQFFTGMAEATACCPASPSTCVTRIGSAASIISQAEADTAAYQVALAAAQAALVCP